MESSPHSVQKRTAVHSSPEQSLIGILDTCFDVAYLRLLEESRVSLDDELQARSRAVLLAEVYGVLSAECERMGKSSSVELMQYFHEKGPPEIGRRLTQELCTPEFPTVSTSPSQPEPTAMPLWETLENG